MDDGERPDLGEIVPGRVKEVALIGLLFCYVLVNWG